MRETFLVSLPQKKELEPVKQEFTEKQLQSQKRFLVWVSMPVYVRSTKNYQVEEPPQTFLCSP